MRYALRLPNLAWPGLAAACWAAPAAAQADGERVWLEVSGYAPSIETRARIDTADGSLGTEIGFESDLAFDDEKVLPALLVGVRLGSRFTLSGEFFSLDRSSTVRLQRDITFGDVTYPAAASVSGEFKTDIYRLAVNYAVVRRPGFDAGVSIGVHATDVEVAIAGDGRVGNAAAQFQRRSHSLLAPLPTVGLFANAGVLPGLGVAARADYFSLGVGKYDATLLNAQVAAIYRIHPRIGLGAGYRHVEYRVTATGDHLIGRVDYNFDGPTLFVRVGF
ncbi:MAG TPA: hypothetical protein VFS49_00245 [Croceibacterium sp.]|nr:hypothetical protein [Croceibacterium sp.]